MTVSMFSVNQQISSPVRRGQSAEGFSQFMNNGKCQHKRPDISLSEITECLLVSLIYNLEKGKKNIMHIFSDFSLYIIPSTALKENNLLCILCVFITIVTSMVVLL